MRLPWFWQFGDSDWRRACRLAIFLSPVGERVPWTHDWQKWLQRNQKRRLMQSRRERLREAFLADGVDSMSHSDVTEANRPHALNKLPELGTIHVAPIVRSGFLVKVPHCITPS